MLGRSTLSQVIRFLFIPAVMGLIGAFFLAVFFPKYFPTPIKTWIADFVVGRTDLGSRSHPYSYADAVERASRSVVSIYTRTQRFENVRYDPRTGYLIAENKILPSNGSGVIINEDGYILTNRHVLERARDIRVALQDGRNAVPEIVGSSKEHDMAVLKIDLDNLRAIEIGDPNAARVGDVVLAIGNPFGVGQTVTQGIISGTRPQGLNIAGLDIAEEDNFLQTDAAINPGNSGGALVDANGLLLGINIGDLRETYYGDAASGIGFAIPVDRALDAFDDIFKNSRMVRGWLGVLGAEADLSEEDVRALRLDTDDVVLLTKIYPNGPAEAAGLLEGDMIVGINGLPATSIFSTFANARPGDVITLDILRDGVITAFQAVLAAKPS